MLRLSEEVSATSPIGLEYFSPISATILRNAEMAEKIEVEVTGSVTLDTVDRFE